MVQNRFISRLALQNPWWERSKWATDDPQLKQLERSPFIWRPALLTELDLDSPNVYTVRGPRQVGKTTLLKLLIRERLDAGFDVHRVLYYSLDLERTPDEIVEVVRTAKAMGTSKGPWCILLDEVSSIGEWQRGIKYLRDQTEASNDCLILTGSSSADMRKGAERLPGRRGPGARLDKVMLPMSFSEFCSVVGIADSPRAGLPLDDFLPPKGLGPWLARVETLDEALGSYATTGGFPRAVRDFVSERMVRSETFETLWAIMAGDADRAGRDRISALRLLERVVRSLGSPMSWLSMAEDAGFASSRTAEDYAGFLADTYVVLIIYALQLGRGPAPRKQKKLYPVDPLFAHLPHALDPSAPRPDIDRLIEAIVAMSLYREVEREPVESFRLPQRLFYWRSTSGREVDFLASLGRKQVPVEVKYRERVRGKDKEAIARSFGSGIILSRRTFDPDGPVPVIPAALFLWLLGKRPVY